MFKTESDSVTNVHKRWSFTRISFSSYKISFVVSIISILSIGLLINLFYIETKNLFELLHELNKNNTRNVYEHKYYPWPIAGIVLGFISHYIDFFLLNKTPANKMTKVLHVSAFANMLWCLFLVFGLISNIIFAKNEQVFGYILQGIFLSSSLRFGIFTSVFGASILKSLAIIFIQPIIIILGIVPLEYYHSIFLDPYGIIFGVTITGLGLLWILLSDRAGRPHLKSTFKILQAFILAWTENRTDLIEEIIESKAHRKHIKTKILRFIAENKELEFFIVLPDIHPGPFMSVGGSDLPYTLFNHFSNKSMILHSISDHSMNIPSKRAVLEYIKSISNSEMIEISSKCTLPIQRKSENSTVTAILFGRVGLVFLSNAPLGMEDISENVKTELEEFSYNIGIDTLLVVDSHNAMGKKLDNTDNKNMIELGKKCLLELKNSEQHDFKIGYSNSFQLSEDLSRFSDLGKAGISVLVLEFEKQNYIIGWIDSNNMKNGLREAIISKLSNENIKILEICTSDTHEKSGKRTNQGYYAFGDITRMDKVEEIFSKLINIAIGSIKHLSSIEFLSTNSNIMVMGTNQFDQYSSALDKAMKYTKICLGLTFSLVVFMLIITR